jgi:hypothetical protein
MAAQGSLFILHLMTEGQLVADEYGVLRGALGAYQHPQDYSKQKHELAAAASALGVGHQDFELYGQALGRLGIYLVRTAAYIWTIEVGAMTFDTNEVTELLQSPRLTEVMAARHRRSFNKDDLLLIKDCFYELVPRGLDFPVPSLEALAVSVSSSFPHAGALLANVLAGRRQIDYAAIALPPM